ncbi:MAG TPA: fructosamine kinase family protein, partial [Coleofasciculaceae cyanobacterium]
MWNSIAAQISRATHSDFQIIERRSIGGGSINQAYALSGSTGSATQSGKTQTYFVKLNQASQMSMFEVEFLVLQQMAASQTIRVPQPICYGMAESSAYIVLEWLELGYGNAPAWEKMGYHLAALHRVTSEQGFGWDRNNTIGSTPQNNPWTEDWINFFTTHRLGYQFQLASRRGGRFPQQD